MRKRSATFLFGLLFALSVSHIALWVLRENISVTDTAKLAFHRITGLGHEEYCPANGAGEK